MLDNPCHTTLQFFFGGFDILHRYKMTAVEILTFRIRNLKCFVPFIMSSRNFYFYTCNNITFFAGKILLFRPSLLLLHISLISRRREFVRSIWQLRNSIFFCCTAIHRIVLHYFSRVLLSKKGGQFENLLL